MYVPTREDVLWVVNVLALLNDGGTLAFPATGLIYRVDHPNKKVTLLNPSQLGNPVSLVTHLRGKVVFEQIGYKLVVAAAPEDTDPPFG